MKNKKPQPSDMAGAITKVIADFLAQEGLILPQESESKYLTNQDIIEYIQQLTGKKYSMTSIDRWRGEGKIPFMKRAGGGIFYSREEINQWLSYGMKKNENNENMEEKQ